MGTRPTESLYGHDLRWRDEPRPHYEEDKADSRARRARRERADAVRRVPYRDMPLLPDPFALKYPTKRYCHGGFCLPPCITQWRPPPPKAPPPPPPPAPYIMEDYSAEVIQRACFSGFMSWQDEQVDEPRACSVEERREDVELLNLRLVTCGDVARYLLVVRTGERLGATVLAPVSVVLYGERGRTPELRLARAKKRRVPFVMGQQDEFVVECYFVGTLQAITIGFDHPGYSWLLTSVLVGSVVEQMEYLFRWGRWLSPLSSDAHSAVTLRVSRKEKASVSWEEPVQAELPPPDDRPRTPLSLGIETLGGTVTVVVPRGTPLPASVSRVFSTGKDQQLVVPIRVIMGEHGLAKDNPPPLAAFSLPLQARQPRGGPRIQVTFQLTQDGHLTVSAGEGRDEHQHLVHVDAIWNRGSPQQDTHAADWQRCSDGKEGHSRQGKDTSALRSKGTHGVDGILPLA